MTKTDSPTPRREALPSQLPDLPSWAPIAVDTETSGLHADDLTQPGERWRCGVSAVSVAWELDGKVEAHAWPFDQGVRDKLDQTRLEFGEDPNLDETEWEALLDWLDGRRLVFHNAKFDLAMLRTGTRHWKGRDLEASYVWDTALAAAVMWPTHTRALKPTAARLGLGGGGEQDEQTALKAWIKNARLGPGIGTLTNPRYDLVDWDVMEPYARADADLTIRLYHHQQQELDRGIGRRDWIDREVELSRVLYRMEQRGVAFDAAECLAESELIRDRIRDLEQLLPFDATVNDAKRYFYEERGVAVTARTEKGAPKLDDETRRGLVEREVQWAAEYDQHVKLSKALSMWYQGWPARVGDDGRLRCTFRQAHVRSGRLSVERVQLQAVPKDDKTIDGVRSVRQFFGAREGADLWNLDLSQAELRVASRYAGCERMVSMLEQGDDLHGITTQEIFGVGPDHPDWKSKRDIAKRLTFGGIFQIGPRTFQQTLSRLAGIRWSLEEAKANVYRWRDLYPEFTVAYQRYEREAAQRGYVMLVGDEPSYFGPRDYANSGWNRVVQGSLASFMKTWLPQVEQQAPGSLVLSVHDSVVLELPEAGGRETAEAVAAAGAEQATALFGLTMKVDVGRWHE